MTSFEILRLVLDGLVTVVAGAAWLYAWRAKRSAVLRDELTGLDRRVEVLAARLDDVPTRTALHELALSNVSLSGDLKAMTTRMDGLAEAIGRLEKIIDRQEDHLLQGGRR